MRKDNKYNGAKAPSRGDPSILITCLNMVEYRYLIGLSLPSDYHEQPIGQATYIRKAIV